MSRLAHFVVVLAIALAAVAAPCQALLTTPELSRHKCCGGQQGMPANSPCQSRCVAGANPGVVPDLAIPVPAMLPARTIELVSAPRLASASDIIVPLTASPPDCLYLRNSSLLI